VLAACGRVGFDPSSTGDGAIGAACTTDADCGRCARCDASGHCAAEPIVDLFVGHRSLCYIGAGGSRWCAGDNLVMNLGLADTNNNHPTPTRVVGEDGWVKLFLGYNNSAGLRSDGHLWNWGKTIGEPVDGGAMPTLVSRTYDDEIFCDMYSDGTVSCEPGMLHTWLSIDTGALGSYCGVRFDHTLWCWGTSMSNDLGTILPDGMILANPLQVGTANDWVSVGAGWAQVCAIKMNGTMWCWGNAMLTGTNGVDTMGVPTQLGTASDWIAIAVDWQHACGTEQSGLISCWGNDGYGPYVLPNQAAVMIPTPLGTYDRFVIGGHGGCVHDATGWGCYGWNDGGQLGVGDTLAHDTIVPLCP
jgi:alpha-tubulin suppressor-like RCC1 family protein